MTHNKNKYDTIVVGGGIAGLTSTAYLARENHKVLLIEKNDEFGGLVNTFSVDGFGFEAGVRALEDAGVIFPMLADLGIELEVVKSPVSVGIENEILNIKDISSLKDYQELLAKIYPESEKEIEDVIAAIKRVMKHMDVLYGIENPLFKNLKRDRAYIFKKLLPWLPRFLFTVRKINKMNMPVEEFLDTLIANRELKDIISQHFFKNTPTFFALSYFSLYLDYFYPKGGVGRLADVLKDKIVLDGGHLKPKTTVIEVCAREKIVKDKDGNSYSYNNLIWAADLQTLYNVTNIDGFESDELAKFEDRKKMVMEGTGGDSVFSLFLQVDEPLESFKKIANGHFFYTPSKEGLGETHRKDLDDLLNNWENTSKDKVLSWLDRFIRLNTYEISIPGLKDPALVPAGKTGLIISFLAEYDLFKKVQDSGWYNEFREALENKTIKVISSSVYPMLKDKIINCFSFTPLSIQNRVGSTKGAITGWSFEKHVPVVNKIQYSDRSVVTAIPNVYQAGQWAYSPAGVPMAILTGKLAADRLVKK